MHEISERNLRPPQLSIAVMTHPARVARARDLVEQLGTEDIAVVCDPAPHLGPATLRTAGLAWGRADRQATHHLVIQDDVIVRPNFLQRVREAVADYPDCGLAFFAEWGSATASAIRVAALAGASWAPVVDHYVPTQALVLPTDVAEGIAGYLAGLAPDVPDDIALRNYLQTRGTRLLVAVPNLVDHDDVPSLIGNASMGPRRSACYSPILAEAGVGGGAVLDCPVALPYFSWWDRAAQFRVWDAPGGATWETFPLSEFFEALDIPVRSLRARLVAARRRLDANTAGPVPVPDAALDDVWLTGLAIGLCARDGSASPTVDAIGELALRTLAPGALRLIVEPDTLSPWDGDLAGFVVDAAQAAGEMATSDARFRSSADRAARRLMGASHV